MARYLSIHSEFRGMNNPIPVVEKLFSSQFYKPVAIGGTAPFGKNSKKQRWFLAGYALEDFVARFTEKQKPTAGASIQRFSGADPQLSEYLSTIAKELPRRTVDARTLSPFEVYDPEKGVTFVTSPRLTIDVLQPMESWLEAYPRGVFHIYGSINLATQDRDNVSWNNAFRFYHTPHDSELDSPRPFLTFDIRRSPFTTDVVVAHLSSHSDIWLQESHALNGLVGKDEADANLEQLASLARLISTSSSVKPYVELDTSGPPFFGEHSRLISAFADVLSEGG